MGTLPEQIATLESRLEAAAEADRAEIADALARTRAYQEATASITPVPPTITLERRMTLHRGGHEIQLLFLGLGHTGGDVVTFLPEQKVLITGDLVPFGLPFMGDGYPEWGETIRRFAELDFDLVLPGHGPPFEDKAKLEYLAAYLDDFWAQAGGGPRRRRLRRGSGEQHRSHRPRRALPLRHRDRERPRSR